MQYGKDGDIFPEQSCSFDNKTSHRFMISYIGLWFLENYEISIGQKCNFDFIFLLNNPQTNMLKNLTASFICFAKFVHRWNISHAD